MITTKDPLTPKAAEMICGLFNDLWQVGSPISFVGINDEIGHGITASKAFIRDGVPILLIGDDKLVLPLNRMIPLPESQWPNMVEEIAEQRELWAVIARKLPRLETNTSSDLADYTPCAECEAEKIHPRGSVNNE